MELSGPNPLGAQGAILAQAVMQRPPDIQKVTPGTRSGASGHEARQQVPDQQDKAAAARDIIAALRRDARELDLPTGPPPSFEVSLLEVNNDLRHALARLEAARSQERDAQALKAGATDETGRTQSDPAHAEPRPEGGATGPFVQATEAAADLELA